MTTCFQEPLQAEIEAQFSGQSRFQGVGAVNLTP
jgi:hypothetical protein